jgi:hypothetical protein
MFKKNPKAQAKYNTWALNRYAFFLLNLHRIHQPEPFRRSEDKLRMQKDYLHPPKVK